MNDQIFTFASNYLSTFLNLNILIITAGGILLLHKNNTCTINFFFILSLIVSFISVILVVLSQRDFFDLLLQYDPNKNVNITKPFKRLDLVSWLDIVSIVLITLGIFLKLRKNKYEGLV